MTALSIQPQISTTKPLDSTLTLRDIIKTLPNEVFLKDPRQAWGKVVINVSLVGLGYWMLAIAPWYLLPFLWIFVGTALTGLFVIGHDCGHRSFANRRWINDLVGHLAFLPLIYPFHSWRLLHDHHHKNTNKLTVDNAWDPFTLEAYNNLPSVVRWSYRQVRGRFWWVGSIGHWLQLHFNWQKFTGTQREQVRFSVIVAVIAALTIFPTLLITTGVWGFVKFWLLPWLVYHFWMSTFTLVHHTVPEIPFKPADEWNEAEANLFGTVYCHYPRWVEFLCHDINVHIPHHVCVAIPSYRLRQAHQILEDQWGSYLYQCQFSWSLMKTITDRCHLYHPEENYQSFPHK